MIADELASQVGKHAGVELNEALEKIKHCVNQLDDVQVWSRPHPALNSIGNLLLHLEGNLTQWIVCGIGGAEDHRHRAAEFSERGPITKNTLLERVGRAVSQATEALSRVTADELTRVRRIQGFEVNGLAAIFGSVPHFRGHTQEIIHMTRAILGEKYQIQWEPTPEQGGGA